MSPLNNLEALVVDTADPRCSNLNPGGGGGSLGGDIGILYSNLRRADLEPRKKKQPECSHCAKFHPCGKKSIRSCTKPCVATCGR